MKILAIVGSRKQGNTDKTISCFLEILKQDYPEVECKTINLFDYSIKPCISCKKCILISEDSCPLKDDIGLLFREICECDGLIVASPNFVSNVSGIMKLFIDRLAYLGHRPRFFNKWVLRIVTSAGPGGAKECMKALMNLWEYSGFNTMKGLTLMTPPYRKTEEVLNEKNDLLRKKVADFHKNISLQKNQKPSLHMLVTYNFYKAISVSNPSFMKENYKCDFQYYNEKGWLNKEKYYFDERNIGVIVKIISRVFFLIFSVLSNKILQNQAGSTI